jgi:fatty-acid desaturase
MNMKNFSKGLWFQTVPSLLLGALTVFLLISNVISLDYLWLTFVMWILVSGLGIAVGYHRVFSHKTHQLPVWKENIILFFAVFAAQGSSIFWTAVHRGYHHRFTDTAKDLHSPVVYGKWHSFIGWLNELTETNQKINFRYSADLIRKPNHVWFNKHQLKLLWGIPLLVSLIDYKLSLCLFCLPSMISTLQDNLVNVVGHTKMTIGYRNFNTNDNSHNNIIFGLFAWGQGWHNNHHHDPKSYDFGYAISNKKWEFDPTRIFLGFLK